MRTNRPQRLHRSSRTPLFGYLRTLLQRDVWGVPMAPRRTDLSRRRFLGGVASGAALALTGCAARRPARLDGGTSVAIVGAGLAGLHCGWRLEQAGVATTLFDASDRVGGRVYTAQNLLVPASWTELGGEFIDSSHTDLLALVDAFGLELMDMASARERSLISRYYFEGRSIEERTILDQLRPLAERMRHDLSRIGTHADHRSEGVVREFDRVSIAEYLDRIGASGWLRRLIELAYVAEYGLECDEQSALNLLFLIAPDPDAQRFHPYGESDERFKVRGGNERIVQALFKARRGATELGHRLVAVQPATSGYRLIFETSGGVREYSAEVVVLALPFTMLREVVLPPLPPQKKAAIDTLGYGTNAKLMFGTMHRPWRAAGLSGEVLSDAGFQLCWDSTRGQSGRMGGVTIYCGGRLGQAVGSGEVEEQMAALLPGLTKALPMVSGTLTGRYARFHWPSNPYVQGSYSCYRPGQWTSLAGIESVPVGNLFFAGEHCSVEFQGFMNGAAESGRVVAEQILARSGRRLAA